VGYVRSNRPGRLQSFGELVQRLFALTTTAVLVVATANVSMDFAGWQCLPQKAYQCDVGRLRWLGSLHGAGQHLAVTALIPLAVIVLLWRLARRPSARAEAGRSRGPPLGPRVGGGG
jgi:hypothetical protein